MKGKHGLGSTPAGSFALLSGIGTEGERVTPRSVSSSSCGWTGVHFHLRSELLRRRLRDRRT